MTENKMKRPGRSHGSLSLGHFYKNLQSTSLPWPAPNNSCFNLCTVPQTACQVNRKQGGMSRSLNSQTYIYIYIYIHTHTYINRLPLVNSQYIYIFIHWEESCGWTAAIPISQRETMVSQLHEK